MGKNETSKKNLIKIKVTPIATKTKNNPNFFISMNGNILNSDSKEPTLLVDEKVKRFIESYEVLEGTDVNLQFKDLQFDEKASRGTKIQMVKGYKVEVI